MLFCMLVVKTDTVCIYTFSKVMCKDTFDPFPQEMLLLRQQRYICMKNKKKIRLFLKVLMQL